ncbi:MAG TPA: hypothetical protein VKY74_20920 [Chloroflexia bacterium]|nr:hypothetical protein [Chloroflexia bacterium]
MAGPDETARPLAGEDAPATAWFAEEYIQACVLDYLQSMEGFTILSPGQALAPEQGIEIVAERPAGDRRVQRLVTVRGWPSTHHTRGERAGQPRSTRPEVTARGWMASLVLDLALGRGADPDVELSLALPAMASYIRYLQRLRWFLAAARISVYLVSQEGRVTVTAPGAPPASVFAAPSGVPLPPGGGRRKLGLPGASRLHLPLLHALITAGGAGSRVELIAAVARWFPEVPQPPPLEFGQRLSVAQRELQVAALSELDGRGIWRITAAGRALYAAEWDEWRQKQDR